MKKIIFIIFLFLQGLGSYAQSFVLDTTFQPFFDITKQRNASISDMHESKSGKLYITGEFTLQLPPQGTFHENFISTTLNGYRNALFTGTFGGRGIVRPLGDSILLNGNNFFGLVDTFGNNHNNVWFRNYRNTVKCSQGTPYFYSDGSSLFGNGRDNSGLPCPTIYNGDTLTRRHILKLTPEGLWDSTFTGDANHPPVGFAPYDSNRILIYGVPGRLTHYNGVRVNGLCRIFLDGTLDTTFTSPLSTSFNFNYFIPNLVEKDGGFFLSGTFLLEDYPNQYLTLVRLKADGSLDPAFMNFSGPTDSNNFVYGVSALATSEDGGYLVGGVFNSYQGHAKNGIAKIDSNGKVQPQYFINSGPDSSDWQGVGYPSVNFIYKSKFGGYYVGGDFRKWNGKSVQPIVRITDLVTSIKENTSLAEKATITVFPNPSNGNFAISSDEKVMAFSVIDLLGKEVISQPSVIANRNESLTVNLSYHKNGIYFLRLTLEDGSFISKKLIKN